MAAFQFEGVVRWLRTSAGMAPTAVRNDLEELDYGRHGLRLIREVHRVVVDDSAGGDVDAHREIRGYASPLAILEKRSEMRQPFLELCDISQSCVCQTNESLWSVPFLYKRP